MTAANVNFLPVGWEVFDRTNFMIQEWLRSDPYSKPIAVLQKMTEEEMEDYVLSRHPAIRASIEASDRDNRKKGGRPLEEVIRGLTSKAKGGKRRDRLRR